MNRVLIGSPVRQKKTVLTEFLKGLEEVEKGDIDVSYVFVDDNKDPESSDLLKAFSDRNEKVYIKKGADFVPDSIDNSYLCDEVTHVWKSENIIRITKFKDWIIDYALENGFDYLFFIDSDIVLHKKSLLNLISRNVDIVSNIFWTQWHPGDNLSPQCFWMPDLYQQYNAFNVKLDPAEATRIRNDFITKLKAPGIYKVDGLGACTLISRNALEKGVRFKEVPNLSIPGEDRHFCIRAGVLGFDLYMDTVYPVYHIFREEYLSRVDEFKRDGFKFDMCQSKSDLVKNEIKKASSKPFPARALRRIKKTFFRRGN